LLYRKHDLVNRSTATHRGPNGFEPAVERMCVTIAEGRHQEAAIEIHMVHGGGLRCECARLIAHGANNAIDDQQGVGIRAAGPDRTAAE
jgi:hypothetical protein